MKQIYAALPFTKLLLILCSDCEDSQPARVEDICPAEPLPPQDCYVPGTRDVLGASGTVLLKVKDFKTICNSPCSKTDSIAIHLEENLNKSMPIGSVKHIGYLSLSPKLNSNISELEATKEISSIFINDSSLKYIPRMDQLKSLTKIKITNNEELLEATMPLNIEEMLLTGSTINISNNPKVKNLKLLSNLKRANYIELLGTGDQSFETLEGLNNLEKIESLIITGNRNLKSLRAIKAQEDDQSAHHREPRQAAAV
jgi:hypothetical protein